MEGQSNPNVSVVLPVHNGEQTIARAIESIIHQTYHNWELLVINDGSTDGSENKIKTIHDSRIRYLHSPHSGIARALNYGIKLAKGRFIARMDADDESLTRRLEKQVHVLESNPNLGLISCQVNHVGNKGQSGYRYHVDWINSLLSPTQHYLHRFQDAPLAHPSVMFRKSLFYKYGGYNEGSIPEDFELWLRWMHFGVNFEKIPEVLLHWHDSACRLSRVHQNYSSSNFFKVKAHYFGQWYHDNKIGRPLWVFGTGRAVNKRIKPLMGFGFTIEKRIDVQVSQSDQIIHYKDLPKASVAGPFILSYVSDRKGKAAITTYLNSLGYLAGKDYLLMA